MSGFPDSQHLRIPGEDTWEIWCRDREGTWRRSFREDSFTGGLLGIPVAATDSAPFWVPAAAEATLQETTSLRWEALGVEAGSPGTNWMHWRAGKDGGRLLVGTLALTPGGEDPAWARLLPDEVHSSGRLFGMPPGHVAVWKELGRLVAAFQREDQLVHTTLLASRELDASAAEEVRDLVMALEVQGLIAGVAGMVVWTAVQDGFMETVHRVLGVEARQEPKPLPDPPPEGGGLMPPGVDQTRRRRLQRRSQVIWSASGALVLSAFFCLWVAWLLWRESDLNRALTELQRVQPEVEAVRQTQLRWLALESATNPDTYPVEVFNQVVSLLPEEGVRFKEFSMDLEKVVIIGEASSPGHASKFQADLKASVPLSRYAFSSPVPNIGSDNRASFRVEGITNEGGADAGE